MRDGRDGRPSPAQPGEALREWRRRHGLTQAQLAARLDGIDPSNLSNLERGNIAIGPTRAERIAAVTQALDPSDHLTELQLGGGWAPRHRPSLQNLLDRLEDIEEQGDRTRLALGAILASIEVRLSRIEEQLGIQAVLMRSEDR